MSLRWLNELTCVDLRRAKRGTVKKKNPQDATLRNIRALKGHVTDLRSAGSQLTRRVDASVTTLQRQVSKQDSVIQSLLRRVARLEG